MDEVLLMDDDETLRDLIGATRTIAVVGASANPARAGFYVPAYMKSRGFAVIGVNPGLDVAFGRPTVSSLSQIEGPVEMVLVFRRSELVPGHLDDILSMEPRPRAVWLQLGIRHDQTARALVDAGIHVIQDRCLMVDHRRVA